MSLKCGIVGLPNVGKSTLFNCISSGKAQSANFPFCTIEPNLGSTNVPDRRLDTLSEICKPQRTIPATVDIVDIAGLVKGASHGEGLGNQFLANIRECDAILHVLRCFDDDNVVHVDGTVDPVRDKEQQGLQDEETGQEEGWNGGDVSGKARGLLAQGAVSQCGSHSLAIVPQGKLRYKSTRRRCLEARPARIPGSAVSGGRRSLCTACVPLLSPTGRCPGPGNRRVQSARRQDDYGVHSILRGLCSACGRASA